MKTQCYKTSWFLLNRPAVAFNKSNRRWSSCCVKLLASVLHHDGRQWIKNATCCLYALITSTTSWSSSPQQNETAVIISVTDGWMDNLLIDRIRFLVRFTSYVRVLRWASVCTFLFVCFCFFFGSLRYLMSKLSCYILTSMCAFNFSPSSEQVLADVHQLWLGLKLYSGFDSHVC